MKDSTPFQMWFKQTTWLFLSADDHVVKSLLPPALITLLGPGNGLLLSLLIKGPWGASPSGKEAGNKGEEAAHRG